MKIDPIFPSPPVVIPPRYKFRPGVNLKGADPLAGLIEEERPGWTRGEALGVLFVLLVSLVIMSV
jgi:hypothetical protein